MFFGSNSARAENDFDPAACYVGAAGTVGVPASLDDELDESLGLHARVGCRGEWAGGEVHFEWLEGFDAEGPGSNKLDAWTMTVDGKLYPLGILDKQLPPLAKRFQPFATVGFGYIDFDGYIDDWDFVGRFGGGLDVHLTRHFALSVDASYVMPVTDELEDLDYVSVGWGFLYRF
jgi:hypothetical protein